MASFERMLFIRMVSPLWFLSTAGISYMMFSIAAIATQSTTVTSSERKNLVYASQLAVGLTLFRR